MEIGNNRACFVYLIVFTVCFFATSGFVVRKRSVHLDEIMPGMFDGNAASRSNEHSTGTTTVHDVPQELCHISVPCAWEVYRPFKRTFEYLIKNTCECPNGYGCVKSSEDLSISAYIYKCHRTEASLLDGGDDYDDHQNLHLQVSPAAKST